MIRPTDLLDARTRESYQWLVSRMNNAIIAAAPDSAVVLPVEHDEPALVARLVSELTEVGWPASHTTTIRQEIHGDKSKRPAAEVPAVRVYVPQL